MEEKIKIYYWRGIRAGIGLMFQIPKKNSIYILDLEKERSVMVHTFFCLKPLDIVILDNNLNIVNIFKEVKPFRILNTRKYKFRYVIEGLDLDNKTIQKAIEFLKSKNYSSTTTL